MTDGYVLVVGSASMDVKAHMSTLPVWETSNLGVVRQGVGGVARNIAENLARLEVRTVLLSAVGDDVNGRQVLRKCRDNRIRIRHVRIVEGARTGLYMALLKSDGEMLIAVADFEIMRYVDREYLLSHERLFADAAMIVIDATLTEEALATVFELAARYNVRIAADPTTPTLATRLCPYLNRLYLTTPNAAETTALCGLEDPAHDRDTAIDAARHLVSIGATIAVVTLGEQGVAYADGSGGGFIRAVRAQIVDSTGAGDAFTGATIFGLLNEVPVDEAMRLGMTAASLTLQSRETVLPDLSQELLYDQLVV